MAGDWLKLEINTPDKPEVIGMADMLGILPQHVLGSLFMIWRWFDQHTTEGNASYVTKVTVDRLSGVTGFSDAMQKVGWLIVTDGRISLPNFDRHNGETAKQRGLTAKRVAKSKAKSNAQGNGEVTEEALPREEKRREDIKPIGDKSLKPSRGAKIPEDFYPDETGVRLSAQLDVSIPAEIGQFTDHHTAKGSVMKDWQAAWRTWARNSHKFSKNKPGGEADFSDVIR